MPARDIVVLGFSAGGLEPLLDIVRTIPRDLPAALFVTHHFPRDATSVLPELLKATRTLEVSPTLDHERIRHGWIYVAPPDKHLLVHQGFIRLGHGPRENGHRPAIDPLFRSAARAYGPRVVGVILSGTMDDGTLGLLDIKRAGGVAVVQDPKEALFDGMSRSAIEAVDVDYEVPHTRVPELLVELSHGDEEVPEAVGVSMDDREATEPGSDPAETGTSALAAGHVSGELSVFTCPDCGGVMWEQSSGGLLRYVCHVGHAYSEKSLIESHSDALETALWTALRALEESAELNRRMARRKRPSGDGLAARYSNHARRLEERATLIRNVLTRPGEKATEVRDPS